MRIGKYGKS